MPCSHETRPGVGVGSNVKKTRQKQVTVTLSSREAEILGTARGSEKCDDRNTRPDLRRALPFLSAQVLLKSGRPGEFPGLLDAAWPLVQRNST